MRGTVDMYYVLKFKHGTTKGQYLCSKNMELWAADHIRSAKKFDDLDAAKAYNQGRDLYDIYAINVNEEKFNW